MSTYRCILHTKEAPLVCLPVRIYKIPVVTDNGLHVMRHGAGLRCGTRETLASGHVLFAIERLPYLIIHTAAPVRRYEAELQLWTTRYKLM